MPKEDMNVCGGGPLLVAALLIALGMIGGSYLLAQGDYAPKVDVSDIATYPSVYVSSTPPEHVISVSATASEEVSPDLLMIQLRVQTEAKNAKQSQADNADVTAQVMGELEKLGISDEEIQTTYYRVEPVRKNVRHCDDEVNCWWESVVTGYRTTHALTVSLTNLDIGGDVVDSATAVGTNQTFVDYISFTLQDETRREIEKSLLEEAAEKATAKAGNIASGLGVSVGKPLSASESVSYPYYYDYYRGGVAYEAAAVPSTEFAAGEIEVSATVSASFEIS
jgi:uncharacterized protein YggE